MGKQKPSEDDWEEDELHGWSGEDREWQGL